MFATWEKVKAACEALVARGEKVSLSKVIAELGGGSKSDVGPLVKRWREENPEGVQTDAALPAQAAAAAQAMGAKLFDMGKAEGRAAFDMDRRLFTSTIEGPKEDLDDSEQEVATLQGKLAALEAQMTEVVADRDAVRLRLAECEQLLQFERAAYNQARAAQNAANDKVIELELELEQSRNVLERVESMEAVLMQMKARSKPGRKPKAEPAAGAQ